MDNNNKWNMPDFTKPPPNICAPPIFNFCPEQRTGVATLDPPRFAYMQMAPRPSLVSVPFDRATSLQSPYGQMIPEKPLQPFQPQLEPQYQPQFMQQFQPHFQQQFQHQWQPHFQQHFQQQCQPQFEPPLQRQLQTQVPAWHPDVSANPNVGQMYNPLILNSSVRGQLPPETLRAMSPQWQQQGTNVPPVYHPESSLNQDEKRFNDSKLTVPKPKATLKPIATSNVDLELEESKVENRRGNRDNATLKSSDDSSEVSDEHIADCEDSSNDVDEFQNSSNLKVKVKASGKASEKSDESDEVEDNKEDSSDPFEGLDKETEQRDKKILSDLSDIFAGKKVTSKPHKNRLSLKVKKTLPTTEEKQTAVQLPSRKSVKRKRTKVIGKGKKKGHSEEESETEEAVDDPPALTFLDDPNFDVIYVSSDSNDDSQLALNRTSQTGVKTVQEESETEENVKQADLCSVGLEELFSDQEVLECKPCGCANSCVPHGAAWVADHKTCYQCRTEIEFVHAVIKL